MHIWTCKPGCYNPSYRDCLVVRVEYNKTVNRILDEFAKSTHLVSKDTKDLGYIKLKNKIKFDVFKLIKSNPNHNVYKVKINK